MAELTKQWIQQKIAEMEAIRDEIPFGLDEDDRNTLAALRIALASLEVRPVAFVMADDLKDSSIISTPAYRDLGEAMERTVGDVVALYTAPPEPVSVPDLTALDNLAGEMLNHAMNCERRVAVAYTHCAHRLAEEVRDLRAAMLQGAENAESRCSIQSAPALDSSPKNAESRCSNSPVIPECSCHACRPVTFADSRFVVCPDCGNKRCPHANDHRNACTGSNEPGQDGSAYPAAPQQEARNV